VRHRALAARVEDRHHLGPPAERADREPAADHLPERDQVGPHAVELLEAAAREPERDHLVDDQHDPALGRLSA
jgi:hypothetical protein